MKRRVLAAVLLPAALLLASCQAVKPPAAGPPPAAESSTGTLPEYTAQQMYLVLAGRRKEAAEVFQEGVFSVRVDRHGGTYEDVFEGMIRDYIVKMYTMTEMCAERGIALTEEEQAQVREDAAGYLQAYGGSSPAYAVKEEDAARILGDLVLVERLRETIMEEAGVEVSEAEARVMDILCIVLNTSEKANAVLEEINGGADFETMARRNSVEQEIERKVGREDLSEAVSSVVFRLEDGETSPILQSGGKYYIVRCVKGYDEEATAVRKEKISKERRAATVGRKYSEFAESFGYGIPDAVWTEAVNMLRDCPAVPDIFEFQTERGEQ